RLERAKLRALPVVDETRRLTGLLTVEDVNEAYRLLSVSPGLSRARAEVTKTAPGDPDQEPRAAVVT
ncbi:MAG: hypothetical protein RRC07_14035, partial [Anaerolineae bacterium]|nr:hypothetical protein [Anaerolineae bacterium]